MLNLYSCLQLTYVGHNYKVYSMDSYRVLPNPNRFALHAHSAIATIAHFNFLYTKQYMSNQLPLDTIEHVYMYNIMMNLASFCILFEEN